jgi:2-hydroxy-3-keto-5-methylthiopentenyl-1-phosphate phosphatase
MSGIVNPGAGAPGFGSCLVSDFDGTIARVDFYHLFLERFAPSNVGAVWDDYVNGRCTHFDALRLIFAAAAPGEEKLHQLLLSMEFPPDFGTRIVQLREHSWDCVVVSAGCAWYIDRLIGDVNIERHANPGDVVDGRLIMQRPHSTPYPSSTHGVDKAAAVRDRQHRGQVVAFAGDGLPDLPAALCVPAELRFARAALAAALQRRGEQFVPFERWGEVVDRLAI